MILSCNHSGLGVDALSEMVLKAVPIYTSDQSDDLRLAPKARLVGRSAFGYERIDY